MSEGCRETWRVKQARAVRSSAPAALNGLSRLRDRHHLPDPTAGLRRGPLGEPNADGLAAATRDTPTR
ncbi:MAG: hypothetical protein ACT4P7_09605 [Gemmatimonadaceae bacterium]